MPSHLKSFLIATATAMVIAGPAQSEGLKQVATIPIPGAPINAYGVLAIDQASGLGYLADKDNSAVVVFDTKTDKYVARITGFVGLTKDGNTSGPNGLVKRWIRADELSPAKDVAAGPPSDRR